MSPELYHFIRDNYGWVFQLWVLALGACVGSFLNVCVLRLPAGKSIVRPGSHCVCGTPIKWYHNIPIFGWFILGGKAPCCGARFSIRYAVVEAATAGVFLWLYQTLPLAVAGAGMVFFALLLLGALIDLDHMILPDVSTVGGMVAGVLLSFFIPAIQLHRHAAPGQQNALLGWVLAVTGVLVGTGVVFWMRELGEMILKKEAMGYGDILLMGCIGAFCGWQGALFAIFGGAVIGCVVILPWMVVAKIFGKPAAAGTEAGSAQTEPAGEVKAEEKVQTAGNAGAAGATTGEGGVPEEAKDGAPAFGVAIPFGPWLALAGFLYYAWLWPWVNAYFEQTRAMVLGLPPGG